MRSVVVCVLVAACVCAPALAVDGKAKKKAPPKPPPPPVELVGTVVRVIDGDTLWLKAAGASEPTVIRIDGIDAPERCQNGGKEATEALNALALNREVTVKVSAKDDGGGMTVGKVFDSGTDIGDRMVRDGQAWSIRYKYDRGPYMAEERMAIALKRGLHASGEAIEPRVFRQRNGPCDGASPTPPSAAPAAAPSTGRSAVQYRCDGRKYCSQMTSCEEATWFLQHCPGVKMDGNGDGQPCEKQWCGRK